MLGTSATRGGAVAIAMVLGACVHRGDAQRTTLASPKTASSSDERVSEVEREARRDVERELEALGHTCDEALEVREAATIRAERRLVGGYLGALVAIVIGRRLSASPNDFEPRPIQGTSSPLYQRVEGEHALRDEHSARIEADLEAIDVLVRSNPDPARWTALEWRAFHERVTSTERECRAFAQATP